MHETGGEDSAGRWLTYAELAAARGITRKAAVRMTQRHRWRRTPGNDGAVRIWVPDAMTLRTAARLDAPLDPTPTDGSTPLHAQALAALETALTEANARADRADQRADAALGLADRTLAQLADAEARTEQERLAADRFRAEAEAARGEAQEAKEAAERQEARANQAREAHQKAMQANERWQAARDTARKARGRLQRAWDGWRGR